MTDQKLIDGLLNLASKLLINGAEEDWLLCVYTASRLMALPGQLERMHHASGKVPDDITLFGLEG